MPTRVTWWADDTQYEGAVYHITEPQIAFAVVIEGEYGFGQIVVDVDPGQRKTVEINGQIVTVIRDYVQ